MYVITAPTRILLVLLLGCCAPQFLSAQIQWNPYAARVNIPGAAASEAGYLLGADLLLGSRPFVPLGGVAYQRTGASGTADRRLLLPLGAGYRLRRACTAFNAVVSGAVVPALTLAAQPGGEEGRDLRVKARLGVALYLDFVTLRVDHYRGFGADPLDDDGRVGVWAVGLGGRF